MMSLAILILMCTVCQTSFSEELAVATTSSSTDSVMVVSREMFLQLKSENDALRKENQMLRRELVTNNKAMPDTLLPEKAIPPEVKFVVPQEDTGYWISEKSHIRHNSRCRNYKRVKGRPCGPTDGRPCKKCGG